MRYRNINNAAYWRQSSVITEDANPFGFFIKPDGTKLYMMGGTNSIVYQYSLTTPRDVSTLSYDSVSWNPGLAGLSQVFFKEDGTSVYISGGTNTIRQYTLGTPRDITTTSFLDVYAFAFPPSGLFIRADGLKFYVLNGVVVRQFSMSTPWTVSTASNDSISYNMGHAANGRGLSFNPNGKSLYSISTGTDILYQYNMSTAWDITTSSLGHTLSVASQDTTPAGLFFKEDGSRVYFDGTANDRVYEYLIQEADYLLLM